MDNELKNAVKSEKKDKLANNSKYAEKTVEKSKRG